MTRAHLISAAYTVAPTTGGTLDRQAAVGANLWRLWGRVTWGEA